MESYENFVISAISCVRIKTSKSQTEVSDDRFPHATVDRQIRV